MLPILSCQKQKVRIEPPIPNGELGRYQVQCHRAFSFEELREDMVMKAIKVSRVWTLPVVLALGLVPPHASVASAQGELRVGTWELNLAKSTFSPGSPPRRQTLTFRAAGPQWTALLQGIDASGRPINPDMNNLAITFDGKDHATANVDYDTTAWKASGANTYEVIRKKAGKIVLTSMNEISSDGKTMTITTKGVNANGQSVHNVRVYDKQ